MYVEKQTKNNYTIFILIQLCLSVAVRRAFAKEMQRYFFVAIRPVVYYTLCL